MKDLIIKDLSELVNRWSFDTKTNLPDYVIAESLYDYLNDFIKIKKRIDNENSRNDSY